MVEPNRTQKDKKPRGKFMPWPFQAALIALLAALGVVAIAD